MTLILTSYLTRLFFDILLCGSQELSFLLWWFHHITKTDHEKGMSLFGMDLAVHGIIYCFHLFEAINKKE